MIQERKIASGMSHSCGARPSPLGHHNQVRAGYFNLMLPKRCGPPEEAVNQLGAENLMYLVGPHYYANLGLAECALEQFIATERR